MIQAMEKMKYVFSEMGKTIGQMGWKEEIRGPASVE